MVAAPPLHLATAEDLVRLGPDARAEIIGGQIVEKPMASGEHSNAQGTMIARLHGPFHRRPGSSEPGGWWILPEATIKLDVHDVFRPDVAGWRRERCPECPRGFPIELRPEWVCDVLSSSNASNDLVTKLRAYHRAQVGHYWIVDPANATLTVLRWAPEAYLTALTAGRTDRIHAEPFEAVELFVGALFGDEEE